MHKLQLFHPFIILFLRFKNQGVLLLYRNEKIPFIVGICLNIHEKTSSKNDKNAV
jgi:hypothetical protein